MKHIKIIADLNERAKRRGSSVIRRREFYDKHSTGILKEVYRIEDSENTIKLYHFQTLTCEIDKNQNALPYIYGESVSDANSISTFLIENGINNYSLGFKKSENRFYFDRYN